MCDERHSYDEEEIRQVMREWGGLGRESGRSTEELEVRRSVTLVRDRVVVRRAEPAVVAARAFKAGRSERAGPFWLRLLANGPAVKCESLI